LKDLLSRNLNQLTYLVAPLTKSVTTVTALAGSINPVELSIQSNELAIHSILPHHPPRENEQFFMTDLRTPLGSDGQQVVALAFFIAAIFSHPAGGGGIGGPLLPLLSPDSPLSDLLFLPFPPLCGLAYENKN
jgi:hypothetical protein